MQGLHYESLQVSCANPYSIAGMNPYSFHERNLTVLQGRFFTGFAGETKQGLTCGAGECKFCGSRGIMDCKELKIGKSKKELLAVFKDMGYEIKL